MTDLDTMLIGLAPHTITIDGVTKPCIFADEHEILDQGAAGQGQVARRVEAWVATRDFPDVKQGDTVTITAGDPAVSVEFTVLSPPLRGGGDGALTELYLREAPSA